MPSGLHEGYELRRPGTLNACGSLPRELTIPPPTLHRNAGAIRRKRLDFGTFGQFFGHSLLGRIRQHHAECITSPSPECREDYRATIRGPGDDGIWLKRRNSPPHPFLRIHQEHPGRRSGSLRIYRDRKKVAVR